MNFELKEKIINIILDKINTQITTDEINKISDVISNFDEAKSLTKISEEIGMSKSKLDFFVSKIIECNFLNIKAIEKMAKLYKIDYEIKKENSIIVFLLRGPKNNYPFYIEFIIG